MKTVSVIIPVYNSEKYLKDLFDSIMQNEFISGDEIILVDNGSSDNSFAMCKSFMAQYSPLVKVYSYADKAGSYCARNYAVTKAIGDILVFTDSDCKPTKMWIKTIRENSQSNQVIAGNIQLEVISKSVWELYDKKASLNNEVGASMNCVATANMSTLKEDFFRVGLFEERFSGGDYDWSKRAAKSGITIRYIDQAVVFHPTRKTFSAILKKEQRIAFGEGSHYRLNNKPFFLLVLKFFAKIFKIDTILRYQKYFKKEGLGIRSRFTFGFYFISIRINHLKYAVKGFRQENVRRIGLT